MKIVDTKFGFEKLEIWKTAKLFREKIRNAGKIFPAAERYSLTDQITRSSRSILALIAEGHGRYTYKDQAHFCIQARGSLSETVKHLIEAYEEKYIDCNYLEELKRDAKELEILLNGYINYLRKQQAPLH